MLIKESNKEKINAMIKAAEGKATERTISYNDIVSAVERIESYLRIPKNAMVGIVADVDVNAQKFPGNYIWTAKSTHFRMERKKSYWNLYRVERDNCLCESKAIQLTLTETAKEKIMENNTVFKMW